MERFAVSLSGTIPAGTLREVPQTDLAQSSSIICFLAASIGVLFPREGTRLSAIPSGMRTKYFIEKYTYFLNFIYYCKNAIIPINYSTF
jgi:hypothetical protein